MKFSEKKRIMVEYMLNKITEEDWHAVADAAADLRVLEAEQRGKAEIYQRHGEEPV